MSENVQELDRNSLFLQAIQERMAQMVVEYETKVAELRVEFTLVTNERDQLLKSVEEQNVPFEVEAATETI